MKRDKSGTLYPSQRKRDWRKCPVCGRPVLRRNMVRGRVKVGQFALVRAICQPCAIKLGLLADVDVRKGGN